MKYQVFMSNRDILSLDADDYEKLKVGMGRGTFVILKSGSVINPSFISHIQPTTYEELAKPKEPSLIEGYVDTERKVFVVTKDERNKKELAIQEHEIQNRN